MPLAVPGQQQESHAPLVRHEGVRQSDEGSKVQGAQKELSLHGDRWQRKTSFITL
jgi:hypothetical protein